MSVFPINAKLVEKPYINGHLVLQACVAALRGFLYPTHIRIKNERNNRPDDQIDIQYITNKPFCKSCCGYGHRRRYCHRMMNDMSPWNYYIHSGDNPVNGDPPDQRAED